MAELSSSRDEKPSTRKITRRDFLRFGGAAAGAAVLGAGAATLGACSPGQTTEEKPPTPAVSEIKETSQEAEFVTIFDLYPIPRIQPDTVNLDYDRRKAENLPSFIIRANVEGYYPDGEALRNKLVPEGLFYPHNPDQPQGTLRYIGDAASGISWPIREVSLVMGLDIHSASVRGVVNRLEYLEIGLKNQSIWEGGKIDRASSMYYTEEGEEILIPERVDCVVTTKDGEEIKISLLGDSADQWKETSHDSFFLRLGDNPGFQEVEAANILKSKKPLRVEDIAKIELKLQEHEEYTQGGGFISFTAEATEPEKEEEKEIWEKEFVSRENIFEGQSGVKGVTLTNYTKEMAQKEGVPFFRVVSVSEGFGDLVTESSQGNRFFWNNENTGSEFENKLNPTSDVYVGISYVETPDGKQKYLVVSFDNASSVSDLKGGKREYRETFLPDGLSLRVGDASIEISGKETLERLEKEGQANLFIALEDERWEGVPKLPQNVAKGPKNLNDIDEISFSLKAESRKITFTASRQ